MFKRFRLQNGRKILLTSLFLGSGFLIAHFVTQYFYRQSLIDTILKPNALIVTPAPAPMPPPRPSASAEPKGGSAPQPAEKAAPVIKPTPPVNDDVKVEVFGLIKFELSESNSWHTIAKIMTVILGTFFGIRAINAIFNKLDDEEEPATK